MGLIANLNNYAQSLLKDIEGWKNKIAAAINTKGGQADPDSSFDQLAADIATIPEVDPSGCTWLAGTREPRNIVEVLDTRSKLVSVISDVQDIQNSECFNDCYELESIGAFDLETIYGDDCFADCVKLTDVNLTKLTDILGQRTFYNCISLESISLPGLTRILSPYTFRYCGRLRQIDFPNLLKIEGKDQFWGNSSLIDIQMPKVVEIESQYCFAYCNSLEAIELPLLGRLSGDNFLYFCSALKNVIMPSLTYMNSATCFLGSNNLVNLEFDLLKGFTSVDWLGDAKPKLRNITIGQFYETYTDLSNWTATDVIAEGESAINELNENFKNNFIDKLKQLTTSSRTIRLGWLDYLSDTNIRVANNKGWTLTT